MNAILPVSFNHLYVVLNEQTYRSIIASDFLHSAFPGSERRSTRTAAGETWSGTYFYCRENYLELFGSTYRGTWLQWAEEGWAGLAFSTDQPGGVAAVRDQVEERFGYSPFYELRQVLAGDESVNWFYHVKLAEKVGLDSFDAWVMEYHPDIFAHKGIPVPENGLLTRQAYLSPWNHDETRTGPAVHPPIFRRITGVTLRMAPKYIQRLGPVLTLLGYTQSEEDGVTLLRSEALTLRFLPEEPIGSHYRVRSVTLEMERPSVAPATFVFAPGSKIDLREDMTAEWWFGD